MNSPSSTTLWMYSTASGICSIESSSMLSIPKR
ncbi:phage minor tail protein L, partial [Escherichia coli MA6]